MSEPIPRLYPRRRLDRIENQVPRYRRIDETVAEDLVYEVNRQAAEWIALAEAAEADAKGHASLAADLAGRGLVGTLIQARSHVELSHAATIEARICRRMAELVCEAGPVVADARGIEADRLLNRLQTEATEWVLGAAGYAPGRTPDQVHA